MAVTIEGDVRRREDRIPEVTRCGFWEEGVVVRAHFLV